MMLVNWSILGVFCLVTSVKCYPSCDTSEWMKDFNPNRFVGHWFAVDLSGFDSSCAVVNFEKLTESQFVITQNTELGSSKNKFTTSLVIKDQQKAAQMNVIWQNKIFGDATLTVMDTDFNNFAIISVCQTMNVLPLSVVSTNYFVILSKQKNMDSVTTSKIKDKLQLMGVNVKPLHTQQVNCHIGQLKENVFGFVSEDQLDVVNNEMKIGDELNFVKESIHKRQKRQTENTEDLVNKLGNAMNLQSCLNITNVICYAGYNVEVNGTNDTNTDTDQFVYIETEIPEFPEKLLNFWPKGNERNSTSIIYESGNQESVSVIIKNLNYFITNYEGGNIDRSTIKDCSFALYEERLKNQQLGLPIDKRSCVFQDTWLTHSCHKNENWGFNRGTPCIVLHLNDARGWVPDVYTTLEELPAEMPQDLKDEIRNKTNLDNNIVPAIVWTSCESSLYRDETNTTVEDSTVIKMSPWNGFPAYYFPITDNPGYRSPLIGLMLFDLPPNVLINVECRMWARNIDPTFGTLKFQIKNIT